MINFPDQNTKLNKILELLVVFFLFWMSVEANRDHHLLNSLASLSFAVAFLIDVINLKSRYKAGRFLYFSFFALAILIASYGIIIRFIFTQ